MNELEKQQIKLLRVIATIFVLICHIVPFSKISLITATAQFFNVGVHMFLLISGYIYANKSFNNIVFVKWNKKRYMRVTLPIMIWLIFVCIINTSKHIPYSCLSIVSHITNLEIVIPEVYGMHHLWFASIIMICYLLLFVVKKMNLIKSFFVRLILLSIAALILLGLIGVNEYASYYIFVETFLMGYYIGIKENNERDKRKYRVYCMGVISCAGIIGICGHRYLAESYIYYIISGLLHELIAISIRFFIQNSDVMKLIKMRVSKRIIQFINDISYEIYITQYIFHMWCVKCNGFDIAILYKWVVCNNIDCAIFNDTLEM